MATNPILDRINENPPDESEDTPAVPVEVTTTEGVTIDTSQVPTETREQVVARQLTDIQDALSTQSQTIAKNITALEESSSQSTVMVDVIAETVRDQAANKVVIAQAADNASLEAQNNTIDAYEAAGGTEMQVQLMRELQSDAERVSNLQDERIDIYDDEFTGVGLIDGIINDFRAFQTDQELDAAQAKLNSTASNIQTIAASTESVARAEQLTKKTLNQGAIEANWENIRLEGELKANQMKLENLHSNADSLSRVVQAQAQQVDNLIQIYRIGAEEQDRQLREEEIGFRREQMGFARERWQVELPAAKVALEKAQLELERAKDLDDISRQAARTQYQKILKDYNELLELEDQLVASVQKAQSVMGVTVEDKETIIWGLNQTGITGERYKRMQEVGASPFPVVGTTPYESQTNFAIASPTGNIVPTTATRVLDEIAQLQDAKYKQPDSAGVPRDEETLAADFNKTAEELMSIYSADIKQGDDSNPYQAPPMSVLSEMQAVKDSTLYQKVLGPAQMKETNPQTIIQAATDAVSAGVISPEEAAAGIVTLFESAALYNNTMQGGLERVGLPAQTSYNTSLKVPNTALANFLSSPTARVAVPSLQAGVQLAVGADLIKLRTFTIDLMDITKVQKTIIDYLAVAKPVEEASTTSTQLAEGNETVESIIPTPDVQ